MSELRQRLDTGEWVIMAPERLEGKNIVKNPNSLQCEYPAYDENCPFCIGNDNRFPVVEIARIGGVRCIENKYQIFSNHDPIPERNGFIQDDIYYKYTRAGNHELIIENSEHNKTFATMSDQEVLDVVKMYVRRYKKLDNGKNLKTTMFKNHGTGSGASQRHPHSQVVSMMVVPGYVRQLLFDAMNYFDRHGECVYCKMLNYELKLGKRIVYENDDFAAYVPYAAAVPFGIEIYPKAHQGSFNKINSHEMISFSDCLRKVLKKLYIALSNVDYNLVFRNPPYSLSDTLYYHWHLKIIPRLMVPGGFELGSNMRVNVINPEKAASILNEVEI
ncbi:MAG TPA: galactose-1-phosphate uridylyltransferase [Victivallales bacterium]|nr:galactose-1-phosphate uridylyltransferase [Victivallales bacterium]